MVSLIDGFAGTDVVLFESNDLPLADGITNGWSGFGLAGLLIKAF